MGSLAGISAMALRALYATQASLQVTTSNISNANTTGYTRRRAVIEEEIPYYDGKVVIGRGATLEKIESLRDNVLELRLHQQTQIQSGLDAYVGTMKQVESFFGDSANDLGSKLDAYFNALTRFSTDATSLPLRQGVLTAASNFASALQTTSRNFDATQQTLDRNVTQSVNEINQLTAQIAKANVEVVRLQRLGTDASAFEDQRTNLVRQLASKADLMIADGDDGLTITTSGGAALVVGNKSFDLTAGLDGATSRMHVYADGLDITPHFSGGELGGTLAARASIASLSDSLDALAYNFVNAANTAHRGGFDLHGNAGGNFFTPLATQAGAARQIAVQITDPAALAGSADTNAGGNGNVAALLAVRTSAIVDGQSPGDYYANLVFAVGNSVANATADQDASTAMMQQLQNERGALSGVSLDEESANLLRYQRSFEAAARVISAVDQLTQVALNIGRE